MLRETKRYKQGTNSDAKETGTQINGVDQKEKRNIEPEKNEETRIQKNEERLRNLQDIFQRPNIRIIGVPEGEEEQQKMENLFEQIMKENFPNLAKETEFQGVQEAQRVPKKLDPRRNTPRHHNHITQDETEGEDLRSNKRKGHSYLQRTSHKTVS